MTRKSICIGEFQFRRTSFPVPDAKAELSRKRQARAVAAQDVRVSEKKFLTASASQQSVDPPPASASVTAAAPPFATVQQTTLANRTGTTNQIETAETVTASELIQSAAVRAWQPLPGVPHAKTKRRKKVPLFSPLRQINPNLPEERRLRLVVELSLEHELKRKAKAPPDRRKAFEESVRKVLDRIGSHKENTVVTDRNANKYTSNPTNKQLEIREKQLTAVIASYERELEEWKRVQAAAKRDPVSAVQPAEPLDPAKLEEVANVDKVLESSTKAIEAYILQTDHIRSMLTKIESRNRETKSRVREIASKLNDQVLVEFGNSDKGPLIPPPGLTTVQTNDLSVGVLTNDP